MITKNMTREQISAFADGELDDIHVNAALEVLRRPEGRAAWDVYHHIADVLRSDDMAFTLRPDFGARMAARLEMEPSIVAPAAISPTAISGQRISGGGMAAKHAIKHLALPGMIAAAAVATVAFITVPQLMVATKGNSPVANTPIMFASASLTAQPGTAAVSPFPAQIAAATASVSEEVVLRDPRIDEYLLAHQRFSPSVYSTAQYARSATFATGSDK